MNLNIYEEDDIAYYRGLEYVQLRETAEEMEFAVPPTRDRVTRCSTARLPSLELLKIQSRPDMASMNVSVKTATRPLDYKPYMVRMLI